MMYKVNTNLLTRYLHSVTPVTLVHSHNTRLAARVALNTYNANLKYLARSSKYEGARLWMHYFCTITKDYPKECLTIYPVLTYNVITKCM